MNCMLCVLPFNKYHKRKIKTTKSPKNYSMSESREKKKFKKGEKK